MNPVRPPQETDSSRRLRAQRATRGLVAQYIHEISDRHARAAQPGRVAAAEAETSDRAEER
jgi:hypothetical protein